MKNLLIMVLFGILTWLTWNYGVAIGYIHELKKNPRIEYVTVKEVDIPPVYDAKALNDYCKFEYGVLKANNWLPTN